ncbi:MAG: hypothetical protein HOV94_38590 [Saccharothrix sp.]|nr:hypothetical protein [Saccharothrix sp.]
MSEQDQPVIEPFGFLAPPRPVPTPAPDPSAVWDLDGGTAWAYLANDRHGLTRPVILADGFNTGPSELDVLWEGLERGDYRFITELRHRGYDLVLVGFDERSASILDNARVVTETILRACAERLGSAPLTVGGFSMGGLVTRYALAKMEAEGIDHQTAVYVSYDSPHNGAWVPIALQGLAHFMTGVPALSRQINSPASRELLWRHIESVDAQPGEDPMRRDFLAALKEVGDWPRRPRLLGVANGVGTGEGNGVVAGQEALRVDSGWFAGTTLSTQAAGMARVALLKGLFREDEVETTDLPELDGAPGGTLETFGIAGDKLRVTGEVEVAYRTISFVPTVSAVAIAGLETPYDPVDDMSPDRSELDDFAVASTNEPHTKMTEELGGWILDRLPR